MAEAQLASKMRFLAAQVVALLEGSLWQELAGHANAMASLLASLASGIPGIELTQPVQASGVFAALDRSVAESARAAFGFYDWDASRGEVRWMCGWDTREEDVRAFTDALREAGAARAAATG